MSIYLIVNADDFGISAGVSRGILEAHRQGIVTSTSLMANMPDAAESIRMAREDAPHLGIGLHLNLSFGAPVLPPEQVPSLVTTTGRFVSTFEQLRAKAPLFNPDEVRAEFVAQFERFIALAGQPPDHLDSHHNISYWHLAGFDAMLTLAQDYGLPIRSPEPMDAAQQAILAKHTRPAWPRMVTAQPDFFDTGATLEALHGIIQALPRGVSELPTHPGYAAGLTEVYAEPRENELRILTDPVVRQWIDERSVHLINFGELPE